MLLSRPCITIFDRRAAGGEKVESLEYSETTDVPHGRYFRYMQALPVQPLCLTCHGTAENIPGQVKARLAIEYPNDHATGYRLGQVQGAVTIKQPVGTAQLLTGDTLLIGGCGRTDFQQGDTATLYESITRRLFTLAEDTLVYPGHDYKPRHVSTIAEEKSINPRLAGKTRDQFIGIMKNLNLPMPGKIGEAISANMRGGKADG